MAPGGTHHPHPRYTWWELRDGLTDLKPVVLIGDDVAPYSDMNTSCGVVTDIHGESFGDGTGDTITVHPAAVTLSTGDRVPVADLVLLRRAEA